MADTLVASFDLKGSVTVSRGLDNRQLSGSAQIGVNDFPSLKLSYTLGEAAGLAEDYMCAKYSIASSANQDIDLSGGLTTDVASSVVGTKIKELIVAIESPDGTKSLRVGPQNVSNGWQGPFGGVGATCYQTVFHHLRWTEPYTGFDITAGTGDILRIHNPGAGTVVAHVLILFTK